MPAVFFYISGHGFGHASRQIEVVNALGARCPDVAIVVRTSAPRWLFDRTVRVPITLLPGECDTGVIQIDSLRLNEQLTIERADAFYRTLAERARQEAVLLATHAARFVVSDAPPLGCAAAAAAGVPSVVITNFTWDWIYEGYEAQLAGAPQLLPAIRTAYRQAEAAWRLPMHGGFATFDTIIDVPFIARHARHGRDEVRRTLGLPLDRPLVLSSFGGYGVSGFDATALDCLASYGVVITHRDESDELKDAPAGVHQLSESRLYGSGLRYEDLVGGVRHRRDQAGLRHRRRVHRQRYRRAIHVTRALRGVRRARGRDAEIPASAASSITRTCSPADGAPPSIASRPRPRRRNARRPTVRRSSPR